MSMRSGRKREKTVYVCVFYKNTNNVKCDQNWQII